MHTNETVNYRLSQFVGTDIPNPLVDYNGDMEKIDTAIKNVADGTVEDRDDIAALKIQNGDETLETTAQTLSGAINELNGEYSDVNTRLTTAEGKIIADEGTLATAVGNISTLAGKVSAVETKVGNAVLITTASDLSGAVNELKNEIDTGTGSIAGRVSALEAQNGNEVLETTAQTLSGAINELWNRPAGSVDADDVSYDNASSGLVGTDVQSAIDEVNQKVDDIPSVSIDVEVQRATLAVASTSVALTFTEQTIGANTLVDVYTDTFGVNPTNVSISGNVVTVTFDAQDTAVVVGVKVQN